MTDRPDEHAPPDHYGVLGVPVDAPAEEIARSFRRQARTWHPDARPDDPDAAGRMRQVIEAYAVLRDPAQRSAYDAARRLAAGRAAGAPPPTRGTPVKVRIVPDAGPSHRPAVVALGVPPGELLAWFDPVAAAERRAVFDRFLADAFGPLLAWRRSYYR